MVWVIVGILVAIVIPVLVIRSFGFKWQTWVALILLFVLLVRLDNGVGVFLFLVGVPVIICINHHVKKQSWDGIIINALCILGWVIFVVYNMVKDFLSG
jgi:hypothetical protein